MMGRDNDSYQRQNRSAIPVTITMSTGLTMRGNIFVPKTRSFQDELNRGETFLEFEPIDGQKMYLARSVIAVVKEYNIPRSDQLSKRMSQIEQFDAHEVLGLQKGADAAAVRQAFVTLAKMYHPDRFARMEMPPEVAEYLSAVATRVNLAYAELRMSLPNSQAEAAETAA